MKTTTILSALLITSGMRGSKRQRQYRTFRAALLARIEAGDRAREALKQVEYIQYGDDGEAYCPWCGFPMLGPDNPQPHSEICMRQIALGLQEPQP